MVSNTLLEAILDGQYVSVFLDQIISIIIFHFNY